MKAPTQAHYQMSLRKRRVLASGAAEMRRAADDVAARGLDWLAEQYRAMASRLQDEANDISVAWRTVVLSAEQVAA